MHCGTCQLGENHVLGDPYRDDDRVQFVCYAFLADGGPGRRVLIDLGPIGLVYLNDMFRRYDFFRNLPGDPDAIRQPHGNLFDWLDRLGVEPEEIDHVVFTHLHADHHGLTDGKDAGGILRLPNAKIHFSRRGWQANLDARTEGRWNSYVDYAFSDFLLEATQSGRAVPGDDCEIVSGVDTIYLNGHSTCSQAVRVQTEYGPAIVTSDDVYRYNLLARGKIGRLNTTGENLLAATNRLVELAMEGAILLPCHEPALAEAYDKHGERWLEHVRVLSNDAARGYQRSDKQVVGV